MAYNKNKPIDKLSHCMHVDYALSVSSSKLFTLEMLHAIDWGIFFDITYHKLSISINHWKNLY